MDHGKSGDEEKMGQSGKNASAQWSALQQRIALYKSNQHNNTPPLHNIPHRITTYMFHATSDRHLMSQHISPQSTIFYI